VFLSHENILMQYNAIIRGLLNYYSFVNNIYDFHKIIQMIIRPSCAKTLARKFKLSSRAAVYKKFGPLLTVKVGKKTYNLDIPKSLIMSGKFKINFYTSLEGLNYNIRTQMMLDTYCAICGSKDQVEIHHIKHIQKKKKEQNFAKLMSHLNRKQIPVCKPCHLSIHKGLYNGLKLSDLKYRLTE